MKGITALILLVAIVFAAGSAVSAVQLPYRDGFTTLAPDWNPFDGKWKVENGQLIQTDPAFDLGASLKSKIPEVFKVSVRIKPLGDFPGGGLYFNMYSADNKNLSHMIRLDTEGVAYGYFDKDGEYQCQGTAKVKVSVGEWHDLSAVVDNKSGKYSVFFDGKAVASSVALEFLGGAVGIESAGGPHAFDDFTVTAPTAAEMETVKSGELFNSPRGIAVDSKGRIYVGQRIGDIITVVSRRGERITSFGKRGTDQFEVAEPAALAFDKDHKNLYVLDEPGKKVVVFDLTGKPLTEVALKDASDPTDITLDSRGNLFVLDSDKCCVSVYDPSGKLRTTFGSKGKGDGQFDTPQGIAIDKNDRIMIGDQTWFACRLEMLSFDPNTYEIKFARNVPYIWGTRDIVITSKNRIALLGALGLWEDGGVVRLLEPNLKPAGSFAGFSIGSTGQRGAIAVGPNDWIYQLDTSNDRICIIPPDMSEPRPLVTTQPGGTATIDWGTSATGMGRFRIKSAEHENAPWKDVPVTSKVVTYSAALDGLGTASKYVYQFGPTIQTIPPTKWSKDYRFMSSPGKGKTALINMNIVVAIYLKTDLDTKTGRINFDYPKEKLGTKIQQEFEKARLFYFKNSRCKFTVTFKDYLVIDDTRLSVTGGWAPPEDVRKDIAPRLAAMGKNINDYDSVVCIYAQPGYEPDKPDYLGKTWGSGLTPFGYSIMGMAGTMNWLFVHEFDHQMDAFYSESGFPEYWCCHPDTTIHPGYFGGQFDVNAHIWRSMPKEDWFWNKFGKVLICDDRDEDGLPDNDPRLPMDEARFGSSPLSADTDGDGLSDLMELDAGIFTPSDPHNVDTDGDGIIDGKDDYPLYPIKVDRPVKHVKIDGKIDPGEWTELMPAKGQFINGETYLNWEPGYVDFACVMDKPFKLEFDIDADGDGWHNWSGNTELRLSALKPGEPCEIKGAENVESACQTVYGKTVLELRVPVTSLRYDIVKGVPMALRIGWDMDGMVQHLFDPWEMPRLYRR